MVKNNSASGLTAKSIPDFRQKQ